MVEDFWWCVDCHFVDKADTIDPQNVTIDTTSRSSDDSAGEVRIRWADSPSPNGLIVLYDIELVKADVANVSSHCIL